MHKEANYLKDLPTETLNEYGLTKTLMTRRETIYLKHIMKNVFVYGDEDKLNKQLEMLNMGQFAYFSYISNKLRGIYKISRGYSSNNVNKVVSVKRDQIVDMINTYKDLKPVAVLDFDKTITNKKFHTLYEFLVESGYGIIINSANPNEELIKKYLAKNNLKKPKHIYANKGKKNKILRLKDIAMKNANRVLFYFDDEEEYLEYGCLLGMYCYKYTRDGKAKNYTFFMK